MLTVTKKLDLNILSFDALNVWKDQSSTNIVASLSKIKLWSENKVFSAFDVGRMGAWAQSYQFQIPEKVGFQNKFLYCL